MVKIAIMGFGTVGSGVAEVITENYDSITHNAASEIAVKYILDVRDFTGSPFEDLVVHDFSVIENDPEVQVVVETIGGIGIAYEFTKRSILAGKSVVSSNKELVARKGGELLALAKENNVSYLFEASVGGGTPIIRPISQCLAGNKISEVFGIMNGTTNYILSEMVKCGTSFDEALKQAQSMGIAEKDPSADINGFDARHKICILSDLCFGRHINPDEVKTVGITKVTTSDMEYARQIGYKIKLVARALTTGENNVTAYVSPHLVHETSLLSNVDDVMNAVIVRGNAAGEVMFFGPGAGKLPTASAVVGDVIDAVRHAKTPKGSGWGEILPGFFSNSDLLSSRWMIRTGSSLSDIGAAFGNVRFIGNPAAPMDEYAFITEEMNAAELNKMIEKIGVCASYRILN